MNIKYEIIPNEKIEYCRDLCNDLWSFKNQRQKLNQNYLTA